MTQHADAFHVCPSFVRLRMNVTTSEVVAPGPTPQIVAQLQMSPTHRPSPTPPTPFTRKPPAQEGPQ